VEDFGRSDNVAGVDWVGAALVSLITIVTATSTCFATSLGVDTCSEMSPVAELFPLMSDLMRNIPRKLIGLGSVLHCRATGADGCVRRNRNRPDAKLGAVLAADYSGRLMKKLAPDNQLLCHLAL
jgi:hypothetical protein